MPEPYFTPWAGKDYGRNSRFGLALMILGESHYIKPETILSQGYTCQCIDEISRDNPRVRTWRHPFYSKIYRLITERTRSSGIADGDFKSFWDSLLFYNFVQDSVGTRPRVAPTSAMWSDSKEAFFTVLSKYEPDCILILGGRLWNALHFLKCIEDTNGRMGKVPLTDDRKILSAVITHPTGRGFNYTEHTVVNDLFKQAKSEFNTTV